MRISTKYVSSISDDHAEKVENRKIVTTVKEPPPKKKQKKKKQKNKTENYINL
jgi:hypothetical protein